MKLLVIVSVFVCIIIYLNKKVLADKSKDKRLKTENNDKKVKGSVSHKQQKPLGKNVKKNRNVNKKSKMKLSKQLAEAKKICWNGQHIGDRIMNGTRAENNTLPWMVAIYFYHIFGKFICGGAIISTRFVLTAAHCFLNYGPSPKPAEYNVRYGVHNLMSKQYVQQNVSKIHLPPKYTLGHNDIALLQLKNEIKYNDLVHPICIPGLTTPAFWDKWNKGDAVLLSGWGRSNSPYIFTAGQIPPLHGRQGSIQLIKGLGYIANIKVCDVFENIKLDLSINICVGTTKKEPKVCHGDSGSPVIPSVLLLRMKESFVFPVVIGVVSFGEQSRCHGPSVLTKVEIFITWINKATFKL